ncbi:S-layer homology domain-containing protein, partial [Lutibacter sp. B2]|nr:S-layer homology domain-containing protein [Lutibacter sp. B2]
AIESMKATGTVTQDILLNLATQISTLDRAVSMSGNTASNDVIKVVQKAEEVVQGLSGEGATKASAAIMVVKQSMGIKTAVSKTEVRNAKAVNISDIQGHWGEKFIKDLISKGAINGYPDGTFKPNKTISFAEFLSISVRSVAGNDVQAPGANEHWASGVYQTAIDKGIIEPSEFKGSAESFSAPISREDMALILVRLNENIQGEQRVDASTMKNKIQDYNSISAKRTYYVEQAYKKGLLGGKGDIGFAPKAQLTRAEAATATMNMLNYQSGTTIPDAPDTSVVQDSIYVQAGRNEGKVNRETSTKYDLQALKTAKFYKEGGKYFVSVNLPELPSGVYW